MLFSNYSFKKSERERERANQSSYFWPWLIMVGCNLQGKISRNPNNPYRPKLLPKSQTFINRNLELSEEKSPLLPKKTVILQIYENPQSPNPSVVEGQQRHWPIWREEGSRKNLVEEDLGRRWFFTGLFLPEVKQLPEHHCFP